jgi:hypothetical protein
MGVTPTNFSPTTSLQNIKYVLSEIPNHWEGGERRTRDPGFWGRCWSTGGPPQGWEEASLSREEKQALGWILGLLIGVFEGKEITNNVFEADFRATEGGCEKKPVHVCIPRHKSRISEGGSGLSRLE